MFTKNEKAYFAGFLDGDGSIYVRLKPNSTYRYGFQVAPYVVFFQSSKDQEKFEIICQKIKFGKLRKRKDGILEYTIGKKEDIISFLKQIKPFLVLKKEQAELILKIIKDKEKVKNKNDFRKLMSLIDRFGELNYSQKRKKHILTP